MVYKYDPSKPTPRLTPEAIEEMIKQGRVSYAGHGISPSQARAILENNMDRFCHPEDFRIDLTKLFPEA
jgi:hypothetical protein